MNTLRCIICICFFCISAQVASAAEFHYFVECDAEKQIHTIREKTGSVGRGTTEYNDILRVMQGVRCSMDTEFEVFATCNEDKTADIRVGTHTGDYIERNFEEQKWIRCETARAPVAVAPPLTPEYSCEYTQRASGSPMATKYAINFNVSTFPSNVTLGEENKLVLTGIPRGNYYLHYVCNKNTAENPTATSVSFKYAPGTRARTETQITGGGTYPHVKHCVIQRGQTVAIGLVDCKKYKNHTTVLTPQALSEKIRNYSAQCAGSGPSDPNACAALRKQLDENAPDFAMICLQNNRGSTSEEKAEQKRLTDIACGVCPSGQEMQFGRCVRAPHSRPPDADDGPAGCQKKNGFWHAGPAYCEVCTGNKVPGTSGCIDKAPDAPKVLPHCSTGTFMGRSECKCNTDEEQEGGSPTAVSCKKKETPKPRDFTPGRNEPKEGDACVTEDTQEPGRTNAQKKCDPIRQVSCASCDLKTHQCNQGQCTPKAPETKTPPPPPTPPCQPEKQPCQPPQNRPPSGPGGNQTGGGPQNGQQGQNGKQQDPLSQLAKQMAQKGQGQGSQGQQGAQQQDPSLMQRLMQMFQPKPFTNPFGNEVVNQVTCESFDIDAPETTGGLYRVKKGEPIEVSWSVSGAKRVTVDTTPRTNTKYDGNIGDATSATVTPSRTGTLTLRLKVDGNLYTKEPCKAKKIRVR